MNINRNALLSMKEHYQGHFNKGMVDNLSCLPEVHVGDKAVTIKCAKWTLLSCLVKRLALIRGLTNESIKTTLFYHDD